MALCSKISCTRRTFPGHGGLCPHHYLELPEAERALMRGEEVPTVMERVVRVYPARSRLARLALVLWRAGVTAAVLWLAWKVK